MAVLRFCPRAYGGSGALDGDESDDDGAGSDTDLEAAAHRARADAPSLSPSQRPRSASKGLSIQALQQSAAAGEGQRLVSADERARDAARRQAYGTPTTGGASGLASMNVSQMPCIR